MNSLQKLLLELNEEAENDGVIDFPEFLSAINNMGIKVNKSAMKRVFDHILKLQNADELQYESPDIDQVIEVADEVEVSFLMRVLEGRIKKHSEHSKARILIQCALMDLMEESDYE